MEKDTPSAARSLIEPRSRAVLAGTMMIGALHSNNLSNTTIPVIRVRMKIKMATALLSGVFLVGCSTAGVIPMGKDTYMVNRGGWPAMNGFEVEADCLKAANSFCEKRGLEMVPVKTETVDGKVFVHNASSKLVFKAMHPNSAPSNPPR